MPPSDTAQKELYDLFVTSDLPTCMVQNISGTYKPDHTYDILETGYVHVDLWKKPVKPQDL